jgi:hypothetical protein
MYTKDIMSRTFVVGLALAAALVLPAVARAHGGHAHKVMGTVSAVSGDKVTLKTPDGKTVTVVLNAKTRITQGKAKADAQALKAGTRVVAEGAEDKGILTATAVQIGTASTVAAR